MSIAPEPPELERVTDVLAAALREHEGAASPRAQHAAPAGELATLAASPALALQGDQAAVERLGRGASRRDPIAGLDPLPQGRDAVTYSTAAVSTGREAGIHWPELVAFRLSDEFPAGPFDPFKAAGHAADNALPGALFPHEAPSGMPSMGSTPWLEVPSPGAVPWLELPSGPPPWLASGAPVEGAAPSAHGVTAPRAIRDDFPALDQRIGGKELVWLDSAATTQKPREVIAAVSRFYERDNSNVHRGAHQLAARATDAYEAARAKVQRFLGARAPEECVFVRGATEAINLVAQSWGRENVRDGDVVLVSELEHHSNIVPWLQLCEATGAKLRVIPVDDAGDLDMPAYQSMLDERVKLVALTQVSNALGTVVPVAPMTAMAHRAGARVLIDGAQAVAHVPVDVQCIGADFYAFSGHKIYAPTGIGVLYGRQEVLEEMPPWQGGGSMIEDVRFERVRYAKLPARFEAGTPNLGGAVGLGAALDYVERRGRPSVFAHEQQLLGELLAGLHSIPGLSIVGSPMARAGAVSFVMAGLTPLAVGQHLDRQGIAVRSGHHCAQPILRRFGHEATVRPSLGIYSDHRDVARLVEALRMLADKGHRPVHG